MVKYKNTMLNFKLNGDLYKGAVDGYLIEKRKKQKRDRILVVIIILIMLFIFYVVGVNNTYLLENGLNI